MPLRYHTFPFMSADVNEGGSMSIKLISTPSGMTFVRLRARVCVSSRSTKFEYWETSVVVPKDTPQRLPVLASAAKDSAVDEELVSNKINDI